MAFIIQLCRRVPTGGTVVLLGTLGYSFGCGAPGAETDEHVTIAEVEQPLLGGAPSSSTPVGDAVVAVYSTQLCTGTLVAPDVVLTAGHCIGRSTEDNNHWETLGAGSTVRVSFGPDPSNPTHTARATAVNAPGTDDILLLGLTAVLFHGRVPRSIAVPRAVAFDEPAGIGPSSRLFHSGYGNGTTLVPRRLGGSTSYRHFQAARDPSLADNYFCFDNDIGNLVPGDSGSPVLWSGFDGPVMGVYQGSATCKSVWEARSAPRTGSNDGAAMTFGRGNSQKDDLSAWLRQNTSRSYCSLTQGTRSGADSGRHRRLQSWYSGNRTDNFHGTQDVWRGCFEDWDFEPGSSGYGFYKFEGWVAAPEYAQPSGTVSLNLYWHGARSDNATLTARPAGYSFVQRMGYVWTSSASGRSPLHAWYSSARGDYLTTTLTIDYTTSGYQSQGIIGYVKTPNSVDPEPTSCEGSCGGRSPDGCYCDSVCTSMGDCCQDYAAAC